MLSRSIRVVILVVLMTGLLPWTAAAEPHRQVLRNTGVLQALDLFAQLWAKIGCGLDPHGLCVPNPTAKGISPVQGEIGCELDPNGLCIQGPTAQGTGTQGEIGCGLDPDGRCVP